MAATATINQFQQQNLSTPHGPFRYMVRWSCSDDFESCRHAQHGSGCILSQSPSSVHQPHHEFAVSSFEVSTSQGGWIDGHCTFGCGCCWNMCATHELSLNWDNQQEIWKSRKIKQIQRNFCLEGSRGYPETRQCSSPVPQPGTGQMQFHQASAAYTPRLCILHKFQWQFETEIWNPSAATILCRNVPFVLIRQNHKLCAQTIQWVLIDCITFANASVQYLAQHANQHWTQVCTEKRIESMIQILTCWSSIDQSNSGARKQILTQSIEMFRLPQIENSDSFASKLQVWTNHGNPCNQALDLCPKLFRVLHS